MQKYLVVIVGIIMLSAGGFLFYKNANLTKKCTVESTAEVVDMKQEFSSDDTTSYIYYPILEYKAKEETVRVTMDSGSSNPAYEIGEKITILYNPNNTKEFIVKGDNSSNIMSYVIIAIGVFVIGYGIYYAIKKEN